MLTIEPEKAVLGATVLGIDLARPLSESDPKDTFRKKSTPPKETRDTEIAVCKSLDRSRSGRAARQYRRLLRGS